MSCLIQFRLALKYVLHNVSQDRSFSNLFQKHAKPEKLKLDLEGLMNRFKCLFLLLYAFFVYSALGYCVYNFTYDLVKIMIGHFISFIELKWTCLISLLSQQKLSQNRRPSWIFVSFGSWFQQFASLFISFLQILFMYCMYEFVLYLLDTLFLQICI